MRDALTNGPMCRGHRDAGTQRRPEIDALRGAQCLDCQHGLGAIQDLEQMQRTGRAHADVVLLVRAGREGVDR